MFFQLYFLHNTSKIFLTSWSTLDNFVKQSNFKLHSKIICQHVQLHVYKNKVLGGNCKYFNYICCYLTTLPPPECETVLSFSFYLYENELPLLLKLFSHEKNQLELHYSSTILYRVLLNGLYEYQILIIQNVNLPHLICPQENLNHNFPQYSQQEPVLIHLMLLIHIQL